MKKTIITTILGTALLLNGCSMEKFPNDKLNPNQFFKTENDLKIYTNSLYTVLPTGQQTYTRDASLTDIMATASSPNLLIAGAYTDYEDELTRWWSWSDLRNINYFLENNNNEEITLRIRNNYNGIARFFRAWFYYEKVKTFGDVPWCDKTLSSSDPDLYAPRESRMVVTDKIIEDLDFAIEHITEVFTRNASTITHSAALALKARVCLFEGTFRKYSGDANLAATAQTLLNQAAAAAKQLMNEGNYALYKTGSTPYRDLFTGESTVPGTEVILMDTYSGSLAHYHEANWLFSSSSTGSRPGFTKTFINTFLHIDGSRFTDHPNYDKTSFMEEVKGRDARLSQLIRTEGYRLNGVTAAPDFGHTKTGYHFVKFTQDNNPNMGMGRNTNSVPIIRYAEVLLVYAEAMTELGEMNEQVWSATVGELRSRARITNTLRPATVDPYMQSLFPSVTNADLLEIRRERAIELAGEGLRFDDLRRWRAGHLLERVWDGIYVEHLNEEIDLNNDGTKNVCFVTTTPSSPVPGVYYFVSSPNFAVSAGEKISVYSNVNKKFNQHFYLYPIPRSARLKNNNLSQNPGW